MEKVVIIGAGIGGLALGAGLRQRNIPFEIYERREDLTGGTAIGLARNALEVLNRLGVQPALAAGADTIGHAKFRTPAGDTLKHIDIAAVSGLDTPALCVQRDHLLQVLLSACGAENVRFLSPCRTVHLNDDRPTVEFENGDTVSGAVVVAADGLRSRAGAIVVQPSSGLEYTGTIAWRGLAPATHPKLEANTAVLTWGEGCIFGMAPAGKGTVYWFGTKITGEEQARQPDLQAAASRHFRDWAEPIPWLIENAIGGQAYCHPLFDRKPLSTWTKSCLTLMGDAAHPMTPSTGQGGAQALQDALTLADCLSDYGLNGNALAAYEKLRLPVANRVVQLSNRATRVEHITNPTLCQMRNLLLRLYPARLAYGFMLRRFSSA